MLVCKCRNKTMGNRAARDHYLLEGQLPFWSLFCIKGYWLALIVLMMGRFFLSWLVVTSPLARAAATSSSELHSLLVSFHNESLTENKPVTLGSNNFLYISELQPDSSIQAYLSKNGKVLTSDGMALAIDESHNLYFTKLHNNIFNAWSLKSAPDGENYILFKNGSDRFVACPGINNSKHVLKWNAQCSKELPVQLILSSNVELISGKSTESRKKLNLQKGNYNGSDGDTCPPNCDFSAPSSKEEAPITFKRPTIINKSTESNGPAKQIFTDPSESTGSANASIESRSAGDNTDIVNKNHDFGEISIKFRNSWRSLQIAQDKVVCGYGNAPKLVVKESEGKLITKDGKALKISTEGDLVIDNEESGLPSLEVSPKPLEQNKLIIWNSNTPIVICRYSGGYSVKAKGSQCDDEEPVVLVREKKPQIEYKNQKEISIAYQYLTENEVRPEKAFSIVIEGGPIKSVTILKIRDNKIVVEAPQDFDKGTEGLNVRLTAEGYLEAKPGVYLCKTPQDNSVDLSTDKNFAVKWSISDTTENGPKKPVLISERGYQLTVCETPKGLVLMWNANCSHGGFKPRLHAAETKTITKTIYETRTLPVETRTLPAETKTLPAETKTLPAETRTLPAEVRTIVKTIPGKHDAVTTTVTYYREEKHVIFPGTASAALTSPSPSTATDTQDNRRLTKILSQTMRDQGNEKENRERKIKETTSGFSKAWQSPSVTTKHEITPKEEETGERKIRETTSGFSKAWQSPSVTMKHEITPKEEETGERKIRETTSGSSKAWQSPSVTMKHGKAPKEEGFSNPKTVSTGSEHEESGGKCFSAVKAKIEFNSLVISGKKIVATDSPDNKGIGFCVTESGFLKTSTGEYVAIDFQNKHLEVTSDKAKATPGWSVSSSEDADKSTFKNISFKDEGSAVGCPSDKGYIVGWNSQCDNRVRIHLSGKLQQSEPIEKKSSTEKTNWPVVTTLPPNLIHSVKESEVDKAPRTQFTATISSQADKTISYFSFDIPFESTLPHAKDIRLQFWLPKEPRFPITLSGDGLIDVYRVPNTERLLSNGMPTLGKLIGTYNARNFNPQEMPLQDIKYGQICRFALVAKSPNTLVSFFQTLVPFTGLQVVIRGQ